MFYILPSLLLLILKIRMGIPMSLLTVVNKVIHRKVLEEDTYGGGGENFYLTGMAEIPSIVPTIIRVLGEDPCESFVNESRTSLTKKEIPEDSTVKT